MPPSASRARSSSGTRGSSAPRFGGPLVADEGEELLEAGGAQVRIRALLRAEAVLGLARVEVARVHDRVVGERAQGVVQAVVHRLGVAAGEVDPAAAAEEERVARDEARRLAALLDEEALRPRRMSRRVE